MQEIANRFKEEYTELLSRYKEHLTNAQITSILQSVTKKQIGFKDNLERFEGDIANQAQVPQETSCCSRLCAVAYRCKREDKGKQEVDTCDDYIDYLDPEADKND